MYDETGHAGLTCRRCGISRPTLRKWWRRYQAEGVSGLQDRSRRPKSSPNQRVFEEQEAWIRELRQKHKMGARRIQSELVWNYGFHVSLATIRKVLVRQNAKPVIRKRWRHKPTRYQKDVPGERVQFDTCKIGPGLFQFTAIDDCTRVAIFKLYPRRTAENAADFLEWVLGQVQFPLQRIQTDRGTEFTAYQFVDTLAANHIKWRPIPPRSPHLNGKVERVQRTALDEFWAGIDFETDSREFIDDEFDGWQDHYNWNRVHGAIGQPPMYKLLDVWDVIPDGDGVFLAYQPLQEAHFNNRLLMEKIIKQAEARTVAPG